MERRKAKILFSKNGNGFTTTKISLPLSWIRALDFNENDKQALIELDFDKIIIRKVNDDMLIVKEKNYKYIDGIIADYRLENDILLFEKDWNGEVYKRGLNLKNKQIINDEFKPIYVFDVENVDISEIEENSNEWYRLTEIIGFKN